MFDKIKPAIQQLVELVPYALILSELVFYLLFRRPPNIINLIIAVIIFQVRIIELLKNKK